MENTRWFEDSRFGMFIHWGLYSNPAGLWDGKKIKHSYSEWLQASAHVPRPIYRKLAQSFNPQEFNARQWVDEAANAGMKYMVITAKHHDGFALWPSKVSTYNVMDETPFKRDILAELSKACHDRGIKFGLYYSHWQDWEGCGGDVCEVYMVNEEYRHPTQEEFEGYWQKKCLPQVRELIENYKPALMWFDSWGKLTPDYITDKRQDELISLIKDLSPSCMVNSRICFSTPSKRVDFMSTMDNCFPDAGFERPWETSGTLNHSWGYHKLDYRWNNSLTLIKNLIHNASLGGNYQLNVGPMGDGSFQMSAIIRLREIGLWLMANGESIYRTRKSPLPSEPWGKSTVREEKGSKTIYLHLFNYTPGTAITQSGIDTPPRKVFVLETGQELLFCQKEESLWIELPSDLAGLSLPVITLIF